MRPGPPVSTTIASVFCAGAGSGSSNHLASELLSVRAGVQLVHVPYRGGVQHAMDLMAGRIDMLIYNLPNVLANVHAGKMRALSQRCSKAYVQATLNTLPDKAREIILSSQRIVAGNLEELAAGNPPAEVRKWLQALENDNAALTTLLAGAPKKDANMEVARTADGVLESADRLTRAYEGL